MNQQIYSLTASYRNAFYKKISPHLTEMSFQLFLAQNWILLAYKEKNKTIICVWTSEKVVTSLKFDDINIRKDNNLFSQRAKAWKQSNPFFSFSIITVYIHNRAEKMRLKM